MWKVGAETLDRARHKEGAVQQRFLQNLIEAGGIDRNDRTPKWLGLHGIGYR